MSFTIYNFEDNDIVIPITVLEELDKFKRGNDQINYHAREFVRELDQISGSDFFLKGAPLGKGRGRLFIQTGVPFSPKMNDSFSEDITDQVKDLEVSLNKCIETKEDFSQELIAKLYESGEAGIPVETFFPKEEIKGNNYYILKNGSNSVLACYDPVRKVVRKVEKLNTFGIYPKNSEQAFALDALMNPNISLVALSGKAGTGKTLLALAAALQQNKAFEQIYLARPIVALSNKDLGYLPGDVNEKVSPYMQPLFDNLAVIKHRYNMHSQENRLIEDMLKDERLVISALAYIRGRSLSNVFFIVDEAQNLTPHEVKTIITRAGEGVKILTK